MNEVDRVAIHEVMEQQTVTIAKAGIHVSLNERCSVLAAANPIYGQYQQDYTASRNIGFPDSLLSRFDLCFIVLDEHNSELDRRISERVIDNHMFTIDAAKFGDEAEDKVIEPEIKMEENKKTAMYEKKNPNSKKDNKNILTRDFLRKYIHYAKSKINPTLTEKATDYISKFWGKIRERSVSDEWKGKVIPITVRTLESLIRLATAFAKSRLSQKVEKEDAVNAVDLLSSTIFRENSKEVLENVDEDSRMDLVEDEEDDRKKKKSQKKEKKEEIIPLDEDEEEEIEKKRSKGRRGKRSKDRKEIEELVEAQIDEGEEKEDKDDENVTEDMANIIFKFVYEYARNKENQTIKMDELWNIIKNKRECKEKQINNSRKLKNICTRLEDEGKIFVSEDNEITLV
jgi:DNA replication licensing factor MCM3